MAEDKKEKIEEIKKEKIEEIKMEDPRPVELEVPAIEEKPKRRRKKKEKEEDHSELEKNLSNMIRTIFDMLSTRDPVWKLADTEVEAVAKPGAKILARLGAEEEANKNTDYLLLIIGIAGIFIPRLMVIKARRQVRQVEPAGSQGQADAGSSEANRTSPGRGTGNVKLLLPGLA